MLLGESVMQKLSLRGKRTIRSTMRACVETLEDRRLLSLSASADAALSMTIGQAAAGAVPLAVQPMVTSVDPANGATDVNRGAKVTFSLQLVSGTPIDVNTLNTDNVKLNRASDGQFVNCNINTDAGGAVVVMQPTATLAANTTYIAKITTGLKDTAGRSFVAFQSTFTTGTAAPAQDANI